jgi:hypothetical protein
MRLQNLKERIREKYRVNMVLDNLPVTTYDLHQVFSQLATHPRISGVQWAALWVTKAEAALGVTESGQRAHGL